MAAAAVDTTQKNLLDESDDEKNDAQDDKAAIALKEEARVRIPLSTPAATTREKACLECLLVIPLNSCESLQTSTPRLWGHHVSTSGRFLQFAPLS